MAISVYSRPLGVEEYTPPLVRFEDYTVEEWREYYRAKPHLVVWLKSEYPDLFNEFVSKLGQAFADEAIALAN